MSSSAAVGPADAVKKPGVTSEDKKLWLSLLIIGALFVVISIGLGSAVPAEATVDTPGVSTNPINMVISFFQAGGSGLLIHCVIMIYFLRKKSADLAKEASRVKEQTTFDPNGKTVLYKRKLTLCQKVISLLLGAVIGFVNLVLTVIAFTGLDLKVLFFPLPFYQHWQTKLVINNMMIKGAKIRMAATYSDAYFLWLKLKRNNLLTCSCYEKRCFFMGYEKWVDKNIEWAGTVPPGFTNDFKIFSTRASLCERIQLALIKYFFGWIPCVTPYAMMKHYKFEVSHMKIGGRVPYLNKDKYNYKSFAITYLKSLCGCLKGVIWAFVDSMIEFDMSTPVEDAPASQDMERGDGTAENKYVAPAEGEAAAAAE